MNYDLTEINTSSTPENGWDIPDTDSELAKLEDRSVKAFFLVNPSNPAAHALSERTLARVVEKNTESPDGASDSSP